MNKSEIDSLINIEKTITNKRRPDFALNNRNYKMNITLEAEGDTEFRMFIRQLVDFPEDFTVGLRIESPNKYSESTLVLLRFQGPHGGQSSTKSHDDLHNNYHIHIYTEEDYNAKRNKASYANKSTSFSSLEEAIVEFMKYCNITDPNNIFKTEQWKSKQIAMDLGII